MVYEASRMGDRLHSQPFEGDSGAIAELGGMRFPLSYTGFYHYELGGMRFAFRCHPPAFTTTCACWACKADHFPTR